MRDGVEGEEVAGFMGNEWCWVGGGQGEECCECQYLAGGAEGWEMHFGYEAVENSRFCCVDRVPLWR